jgi:perosamine synthetase
MFYPYVADDAVVRVEKVMRDRWIGQGGLVNQFEREVEKTLSIPYAIAVNCSSSALRLALSICGVGPGDEVITTPLTCTLTNHPILEQFAVPVFADIQYETGNISPTDIESRISERTKAILCTHWGGAPSDLDEINKIGRKHRLTIIEDASEAFGASYKGIPIGAVSRFTAFSFQAIQIITTGEGGMLATLQPEDAQMARIQRWYGIDRETRKSNLLGYFDFDITLVGYGYHMTNLAAAMGLGNLPALETQKGRRQQTVDRYHQGLRNVPGVTLLINPADRVSSNHFFTIHVEKRDDFCRMMRSQSIEVSIVHYRNDAYTVFGGLRDDLPNLERFDKTYIALPSHAFLTLEDVEYIIASIQAGWG